MHNKQLKYVWQVPGSQPTNQTPTQPFQMQSANPGQQYQTPSASNTSQSYQMPLQSSNYQSQVASHQSYQMPPGQPQQMLPARQSYMPRDGSVPGKPYQTQQPPNQPLHNPGPSQQYPASMPVPNTSQGYQMSTANTSQSNQMTAVSPVSTPGGPYQTMTQSPGAFQQASSLAPDQPYQVPPQPYHSPPPNLDQPFQV